MAISRYLRLKAKYSIFFFWSISVQSSFGVGAVLNATFGSIIEIVLYATAITKGTLNDFVHASITGSLLATMLLLPGIAMIVGNEKIFLKKK